MKLTIRKTVRSDFDAVKNILEESGLACPELNRETLAKGLVRNNGFYWVAEVNGVVVGTVFGFHDGWQCGCIYKLAVRAEHRNKGIGTQLIEQVRQEFNKAGIRWAFGIIRKTNTQSLNIFESIGLHSSENHYFASDWHERN